MEGYRKMVAGLFLVVVAGAALYFNLISSDNFMVIVSSVAASLGLGNGLEWIGKGLGGKRNDT